jgi:hypothetical protein
MAGQLLLLALMLQGYGATDSADVYAAILQDVRREYRGLPVALAETRAGVACMPHCGARIRDPDGAAAPEAPPGDGDHSPALLRDLRSRGLIDHVCAVVASRFGCSDYPGHLFVALGDLSAAPTGGPAAVDGAVWVKAAFLVPCTHARRCPQPGSDAPYFPDAFGTWFLLKPGPDGNWHILRRAPAFFV